MYDQLESRIKKMEAFGSEQCREIERLEAECDRLREQIAIANGFDAVADRLQAENEALRTRNAELVETLEQLCSLTHRATCEAWNWIRLVQEEHCTCGAAKARGLLAKP